MKLVELLARELKEWAYTTVCYCQDGNGDVYPWVRIPRFSDNEWGCARGGVDQNHDAKIIITGGGRCEDYTTSIVTRDEWESERAKLPTPSGRAEELITQLEAEIVKRDARITELEAENARLVRITSHWQEKVDALETELAPHRISAGRAMVQKPSAGVVLPSENSVMRIVLREMGNSTHVRGTSNWCAEIGMAVAREVASLNPCRAQAVPDVYAMARVLAYRCADACNVDRDDYWKQYGEDCIEDVRAMLAAAPSSKKESE